MQAIVFYLFYPIIILFSSLPMRVLYGISSYFVYPMLHKVLKYRIKVVRTNMRNVFPEKSEGELLALETKFYKFLADLFVEVFKGFTQNEKGIRSHVNYLNPEVLEPYFEAGRNCELTTGHLGNYEWVAKAFPLVIKHKMLIPYRKLSNKYFNNLFKKSRERFGVVFFPTKDTAQYLKDYKGIPYFLGLANDQSAPPQKSFWVKFLNQDTSFFMGTEKMAIEHDLVVFYAGMKLVGRGKYETWLEIITDKPKEEPEGFIMREHARLLEQNILADPAHWLWTHKRWKHDMPEGQGYGFS